MNQPVITKAAADDLALGANGSYSNEGNALQHTLYDSALVPSTTAAQTSFFTVPIGGTYGLGGVKSLIETNLQDPGKLPNGQTFLIKAMSVALKLNMDDVAAGSNGNIDDLINAYYTIQENSTWEIKIAGREFDFQAPGTEFIPTIHGVGVGSSTATVRLVGDVMTAGWCKLAATPIPIGQLVSFQVIQRCASVNAATQLSSCFGILNTQEAELQVRLRGLLTRSI